MGERAVVNVGLEYYGRFVEPWKDADPELQPRVQAIRDRMAKLAGEPGS